MSHIAPPAVVKNLKHSSLCRPCYTALLQEAVAAQIVYIGNADTVTCKAYLHLDFIVMCICNHTCLAYRLVVCVGFAGVCRPDTACLSVKIG